MTKLIQYTHRPNNTELGKGNTNDAYLLIGKDVDLSQLFPNGIDVQLKAVDTSKVYTVRAAVGREFRINQFSQLYHDYNMCEGDELIITVIKTDSSQDYFIRINIFNKISLSQSSKGCVIGNIERLSNYGDKTNGYVLNATKDGVDGTLEIVFDGAKPKRTDSPELSDFYTVTFNGEVLDNGLFFYDLNDTVIYQERKAEYNEIIICGEDLPKTEKTVKNTTIKSLDLPRQQIYYGAPGTGKSQAVKRITDQQPVDNVFRTTFHPDSDYSTFVGCYKPKKVNKLVRNVAGDVVKANGAEVSEEAITYEFVPQAFTKAYMRAYQMEAPVYLVIEEINRGNCAQIFGDLFQLLDRKDGVSEYPIKADNDLCAYIKEQLGEDSPAIANDELRLPSNLYIWATMNTSDQSLFPIDSAFKRRWEWKYERIAEGREEDGKTPKLIHVDINGKQYDWWSFINNINARIFDITKSEDKKLGYWFCKDENKSISAERFVSKVCFYLWNDVFKSYGFGRDNTFKKDGVNIAFDQFYIEDKETFKSKINEQLLDELMTALKVETKEQRKAREDNANNQAE